MSNPTSPSPRSHSVVRSILSCGLAVASLVAMRAPAAAAPTVNQDLGTYFDTFVDPTGIATDAFDPGTGLEPWAKNVRLNVAGQLVTLADQATTGRFATPLITPTSFSGWGKVYLDFTAYAPSDLVVRFAAEDGTLYGPFPLVRSDDAAFQRMAVLGLPSTIARGRVVVDLASETVNVGGVATTVKPALLALKATWSPTSAVRVSLGSPKAEQCTNETFVYTVQVSVSSVAAPRLVVWVPMPVAAADPYGAANGLQFVNATNGGYYTSVAINVGGVPIPEDSIVFDLGAQKAGTTLRVSFTARIPTGTTDDTVYVGRAYAQARQGTDAFGGLATSAQVSVQAASAPGLGASKRVVESYYINNLPYVQAGTTGTYEIEVANFYGRLSAACTERYRNAVVVDDVSALLTGNAGGPYVEGDPGIVLEPSPYPSGFVPAGSSLVVDGVTVNGPAVYWQIGTLGISDVRTLRYSVTFRPGAEIPEGSFAHTAVTLESAVDPEQATVSNHLGIGYPRYPNGFYAAGDSIVGVRSIAAQNNDNRSLSLGYGDTYTLLLSGANAGAARLDHVVYAVKIPTATTFAGVYVPPDQGATVYYSAAGAANEATSPPGFDIATGTRLSDWSTTPPSTVRWVLVEVDHLASTLFPNPSGLPTSLVAEVRVTVDLPSQSCPLETIEATGLFNHYGYTPEGETASIAVAPPAAMVADAEQAQVVPTTPGFDYSGVGMIPSALPRPGTFETVVSVLNQQVLGAPTDTARDVVVEVTLPHLLVGGVDTLLATVVTSTDGGTPDYSSVASGVVRVTYPTIEPRGTRRIRLKTTVPSGYDAASTTSVSATIRAVDPECGPVEKTVAQSIVLQGNPTLTSGKRANLSVVRPNSPVTYTLETQNVGDVIAHKAWLVDQISGYLAVTSATATAQGGEVWFAARGAAGLPGDIGETTFAWSDEAVRATFVKGTVSGGVWLPPANMQVGWVAYLLDTTALDPAGVAVAPARTVELRATVSPEMSEGAVIRNRAAIFSAELLAALGNESLIVVSGDPSMAAGATCGGPYAPGETFSLAFDYANDSTNDGFGTIASFELPSFVGFVAAHHAWNAAVYADTSFPNPAPEVPCTESAGVVTCDIGGALDPTALGSLEGGRIVLDLRVLPGTPPGTATALIGSFATSSADRARTALTYAACDTAVEVADVTIDKDVDNATPAPGEVVTFTLDVSNVGKNVARDVVVTDSLPAGLSYVAGTIVATPGWTIGEPTVAGSTLSWSREAGNALTRTGGTAGVMPSQSGPVRIVVKARVSELLVQGSTVVNGGSVATTSLEANPGQPNSDTASVRVPFADPYVEKYGPATAVPRGTIGYTLRYGNRSPTPATDVVVVDHLPGLKLIAVRVSAGETVYYNTSAGTVAPALDLANPGASGWTTTRPASGVTNIAVQRALLPGRSGPYTIQVDVEVRGNDGVPPLAGETITNCATIGWGAGNATEDESLTNNAACARAAVPGVDLALDLACEPDGAYPGVLPGDAFALDLAATVTGTVTTYGVWVDWTPPSWLVDPVVTATNVDARDASGNAVAALDLLELPTSGTVPWTRVGNRFYAGTLDAGSPTYYRRVGWGPGTRFSFRVTGTVDPSLATGTYLPMSGTVGTDLRADAGPGAKTEENLANNVDSCGPTVELPDPMVAKRATAASLPLRAGDVVDYRVEFNNVGYSRARDVNVYDELPKGMGFVVGSATGLPDGATLQYDDGSGTFSYTPVGAVDHGVTALRVVFAGPMDAPAAGGYVAERAADFARGTLANVAPTTDGEALTVAGWTGDTTGTYTTELFPPAGDKVTEWMRVVVAAAVSSTSSLTVDVLDGNGVAIRTGLVPDISGAVSLAGIDPVAFPRLALRLHFQGGDVMCDYEHDATLLIPAAPEFPPESEPTTCLPSGAIIGQINLDGLRRPAVWESITTTPALLPIPAAEAVHDFYIDWRFGELVVGHIYDRSQGRSRSVVWGKVGGAWSLLPIAAPGQPVTVAAGDSSNGTLVGSRDGSLAIWRLQGGALAATLLTAAGRDCVPYDAREGVIVGVCNNDVDGPRTIRRWSAQPDGSYLEEGIGVASGLIQQMLIAPNGDVTGGAQHVYAPAGWSYPVPFRAHFEDGAWSVADLTTVPDSAVMYRFDLAPERLVFTMVPIHYVSNPWSGYWDYNLDAATSWVSELRAGVWSTTQLAPPAGVTAGVVNASTASGVIFGQSGPTNNWSRLLWVPNGDGTFTASVLPSDIWLYYTLFDGTLGGFRNLPGNKQTLVSVAAPVVDGVGVADFRWFADGPNSDFVSVPIALHDPATIPACGYLGRREGNAILFPQGGFGGPATTLAFATQRSAVTDAESENHGTYLGYTGKDWDVITAWRPQADGTVKQYVLPEPPGYTYEEWLDIGSASLDGRWILATYYPSDTPYGESIVLYRYDDATDSYVVDRLSATLGPDFEGYTDWPDWSTYRQRTPDVIDTQVVDADGKFRYGYLLAMSTATKGFVFTLDIPLADGTPVVEWDSGVQPLYGSNDVNIFSVSSDDMGYLAAAPDPTGLREAVAVPLPLDFAQPIYGMGWRHSIAARSTSGAATYWRLEGDLGGGMPGFREIVLPAVPGASVVGLGQEAFPGTDYPLAITRDEASYTLWTPDANGAYQAVVPALPAGYTAFEPYRDWSAPSAFDPPKFDASGFEQSGLFGGKLVAADGSRTPAFVGLVAGEMMTVPLPLPATAAGSTPMVAFATQGPVIYGTLERQNSTDLIAWYFPTGDLAAPAYVTIPNWNAIGAGYFRKQPFAMSGSNADHGPIVPVMANASDNDRFGFLVPHKDARGNIARLAFVEAPSFGRAQLSAYDFSMVVSPDNAIVFQPNWNTDRASVWGCWEGAGVAVDAVRATYRGSANPGFDYQMKTPDLCQARVVNTATISASTPQITAANDAASVELPVATVDLGVALSADRGTLVVDQAITYAVTVTNRGPTAAHGVTVELNVPDTTDPTGSLVDTQRFDLCADFGVCELASGASYTLPGVTTDPSTIEAAFVALVGSATVASSDITCATEDDTVSVTTLTGALPNVGVTKTGPATSKVGKAIDYTITYRNNGNADATQVVVTDTPPAGVTLDAEQALSWTAEVLAPSSEAVTRTVRMQVDDCALVGTRITNTVAVTSDFDVLAADDQAAASTLITPPGGALTLVAVPSQAKVGQGGALAYTLRYRNTGAEPVLGGVLHATVPEGATFAPEASTPGFGLSGREVTWVLPGSLAAGASGAVSLAVRATGAVGADLAGSAWIDVAAPSVSNACDVSATYAAASIAAPGLVVTKRASAATSCGGNVDWIITVANQGGTSESNLVVVDTVPSEVAYVAGSIAGPGASGGAAPVLVWSIGTLAPGQAVTLGYRTSAPTVGAVAANVAEIQRGGATIARSAPTLVAGACGDAGLVKSLSAGCSEAADVVDVTVTYTSGGGSLTGVQVVDALEPGFTLVSADAPLAWNPATGVLTASLGDLAAGVSGALHYRVAIGGAAGAVLSNRATLASNEGVTAVSNDVSTVVQSCDDADPCTADGCAAFAGCVHELVPTPEVPEVCDGVDNDCDRLVDAGDPSLVPEPCELVDGVCAGTVTTECVGGEWSACTTSDYLAQTQGVFDPADATCDGVDNDCDGVPDDGFVGDTTPSCGTGVCQTTSQYVCVDGAIVDPCEPLPRWTETDRECDGLDTDCDGTTDEDFVGGTVVCMPGTCSGTATGSSRCLPGGQLVSDCDPAYGLAASDPAYHPGGAADPVCDAGPTGTALRVTYGVVYDDSGAPVGSVRCTLDPSNGAVLCDTKPGTTELLVLDGAYCPAE